MVWPVFCEYFYDHQGQSSFPQVFWLYQFCWKIKDLFLNFFVWFEKRFAFIKSIFGEESEVTVHPPDFHHPGVVLDQKENASVLFKAIGQLPENQRIAFTLHKVDGLSYQEVSEVMETSVSSVESLIHRAKTNLKKKLEDYYKGSL